MPPCNLKLTDATGERVLHDQNYPTLTDLRDDLRAFRKADAAGELQLLLPGQTIVFRFSILEEAEPVLPTVDDIMYVTDGEYRVLLRDEWQKAFAAPLN